MTPSSKRTVLGSLSVISFILATVLIYRLPFHQNILSSSSSFYLTFAGILISFYNIAIIFAWLGFGRFMGVTITILSVVFVLILNLRIGLFDHTIYTLPFFFTAFIGFRCTRAQDALNDSYHLKLEKLGEDINILSNEIEEKKRGIFSVEEKLKRYAVLKEVIESFSTQLLLDDIKKLIMEKASRILGRSGRTLLFLVDTEKQELMLSASRGAERVSAKKGDLFDRWVLKHRKSLIVEDIVTDFRFSTDSQDELKKVFRALIASPLMSGDKVIGILRMDNEREFIYAQDDLRLLGIIADIGAVAIENALLYARTQELAMKDSLTGLAVRRYFMGRLHEEVKRTVMRKSHLSLLMIDIDHFKKYNDQFGHAAGDIVLKHLALTMNGLVKEGDIVARYGGEEIVIMLCGRSKEEATLAAEEISRAIKSSPVTLRRHIANVTISVGISSYPEDSLAVEGLIRIADERLYKAKAQGRDRVCSA